MAAIRHVLSLTALSLLGNACSDNPRQFAGATSAPAVVTGPTATSTGPSAPSATPSMTSAPSATPSMTSASPSVPSTTPSMTSTGPSIPSAMPSMTSTGPSIPSAMPSTTSSNGEPDAGTGGGDVEESDGCGEPRTLQNGTINIMFDGASRNYILRVPEDYDNTHPYRLVFAYAESGSSAASVVDRDYFRMATLDDTNTIFVAPDAANGAGSWSASDLELTDDILAELEADLCIDKTRIFATGFSFGGAMSVAIACQRADVFRGVAFFSGADLTGSCNGTLTTPIAYYASQASGDSSGDPIPSSGRIKQAQFAEVNGCTAEPDATTFPAAGQPHRCTVYQGCSAGHPTVYCVFNGDHGWEPRDPGESMSWNAPLAWEFITQF